MPFKWIPTLAAALMLAAAPTFAQDDTTLGSLTISAAMARATPPHAPVGGGFLTITNGGDEDDRLVAASTPIAGRVEIHEMKMDGDVMRMRPVTDGLPIPAGQTVVLEPGGYHLMLMELTDALTEGDTFELSLTFEKAGEVTVTVDIGPRGMSGAHGMRHSDG
ncbi:copper chaperone PCu(A)C [Silicimonas algicola]|uniref:Copper(I)-binding protein n=1 Tax=Silicimonas algicola TaxID=1826607 RepID=A0A316G6G1_9RHOB|nr:copper chaperone PCu(A)C [Silicimonas algicola]AZQ69326.1 copper chaperone PCu(A)C [Silicimonas algicola]PWK56388.1 hypothetical protein C8D95_10459 [Silicimonas algicola]